MKKLFSLLFVFALFQNVPLNAQTDSCEFNQIGVSLSTQIWAAEMSWDLSDMNGNVVASGGNYADNSTYSSQFCLEDGCYTLNLYDTFGDGWNGGTIEITYDGITLASPVFLSGSNESVTFGLNTLDCYLLISGCTDPLANNYDPLASIDDGSCDYDSTLVYGCTDYLAINFNPFATIDDGSCEYDTDSCNQYEVTIQMFLMQQNWLPIIYLYDDQGATIFSGAIWDPGYTTTFCLPAGCYGLEALSVGSGNTGLPMINVFVEGVLVETIFDIPGNPTEYTFGVLSNDCDNDIFGCTDPLAINYNPTATVDDSSCEYAGICVEGWINGAPDGTLVYVSNGFDLITTTTDNGSFWTDFPGTGANSFIFIDYFDCNGVMQNVIAELTATCYVLEAEWCAGIVGCTDPIALNYNADATIDDGSCVYAPDSCFSNVITFVFTTGSFANEVEWNLIDSSGNIIHESEEYSGGSGSSYLAGLCLEDGCYSVQAIDTFGDGWNGGVLAVFDGTTPIIEYTLNQGDFGVFSFGVNDPDCQPDILGCTDPLANNYNPFATVDDGSCIYPFSCDSGLVQAQLYVCTFANGWEVGISISDSSGDVIYSQDGFPTNNIEYIDLCLDSNECYTVNMWNNTGPFGWYNGYYWINAGGLQVSTDALAYGLEEDDTIFSFDGSCFEEILGCTDIYALNYNPLANVDDGSCEYLCDSTQVPAQLYVCTFANGWEVGISIEDSNGNIVYTQDGYPTNNIEYIDLCLDPDECYTVNMWNNAGPYGWYNGYFWINNFNGVQLATGQLWNGFDSASLTFSINGPCGDVYGCTDFFALNYNPNATIDDGSCIYDNDSSWVYGCTDFFALNYNPDATIDDGSCIYDNDSTDVYGCTDPFAINYDPFATINDGSCLYDSLGTCLAYFEIYYIDESQDVVYIENLSSGPFLSYLWDFGDGSTSNEEFPVHEYNADGTYTVCLTVWSQLTGGICQDTYCLEVEYNGTGFVNTEGFWINVVPPGTNVGIDDINFIDAISIYPNPSSIALTLEFNGNLYGDVTFEILDISGRLIHSETRKVFTGNNTKILDVQDYESGAYLLRLRSENSARTTKFNVIR